MVSLRGMTWDHARGYDPMVATSAAYAAAHPGVTITWEKRSLQAFADRPISEMAALAAGSVGLSHPSYNFAGRQWSLAIDTATPVACLRPDLLGQAPKLWAEVLDLARAGRVGFALIPINALMTFFGMARNLGYGVAEDPDHLIAPAEAAHVLGLLREILALIDPRCLRLDPIGIYEWMGRTADAPAYSPFGYGYTNYSRKGFCPWPLAFHDAPGIAEPTPRGTVLGGTGIAVSAYTKHPEVAVDYAFWIAGAECQKGLFTASGGQPGHAAAWEDDACNALTGNFFRNTRRTLETAWLRPRYDGYMGLQDRAGDILHACLRGEATEAATLAALDAAYRESRA